MFNLSRPSRAVFIPAGAIRVADRASSAELARHVEAGNPPHTFTGAQLGMAV